MIFKASHATRGRELFWSDGTSRGTRLLADINQGPLGSNPEGFTAVGKVVVFSANDGSTGYEPWRLRP